VPLSWITGRPSRTKIPTITIKPITRTVARACCGQPVLHGSRARFIAAKAAGQLGEIPAMIYVRLPSVMSGRACPACSEAKGLLARGCRGRWDDEFCFAKTSARFPTTALQRWCKGNTSIPALLLTVENRKQTGVMFARSACERRPIRGWFRN